MCSSDLSYVALQAAFGESGTVGRDRGAKRNTRRLGGSNPTFRRLASVTTITDQCCLRATAISRFIPRYFGYHRREDLGACAAYCSELGS